MHLVLKVLFTSTSLLLHAYHLRRDSGVVTIDNEPMSGARVVVLHGPAAELRWESTGPIIAGADASGVGTSDENGRFSMGKLDKFAASDILVLMHQRGVAVCKLDEARGSPSFSLVPWATLRGTAMERGAVVPRGKIVRLVWRPHGSAGALILRLSAYTDDNGTFEFRLPPGDVEVYRVFFEKTDEKRINLSTGLSYSVNAESGRTVEVVIGAGREVVGRVEHGEDEFVRVAVSRREAAGAGNPKIDRKHLCGVKMAPDGSFRTEGLPPGNYSVDVRLYTSTDVGGSFIAQQQIPVTIESPEDGKSVGPVDLGAINLR